MAEDTETGDVLDPDLPGTTGSEGANTAPLLSSISLELSRRFLVGTSFRATAAMYPEGPCTFMLSGSLKLSTSSPSPLNGLGLDG